MSSIQIIKDVRNHLLRHFPGITPLSSDFYKWHRFLEESQWWSEEKIKNYQLEKLKSIVEYSFNNVPYYKNYLRSVNCFNNGISSFSDFKSIPFTTKEIVRDDPEQFLPISINKSFILRHATSGSTGEPLTLFKTKSLDIIENAFMYCQWSRVGYKPKDLSARIRGEELPDKKIYTYDHASNTYVFSLVPPYKICFTG